MLIEVLTGLRDEGDLKIVSEGGVVRQRGCSVDWTDKLIRPDRPSLFSFWNPALRR